MSLSQDISEYTVVPLDSLKPETPIPFSLFLYLSQNLRIIPWKAKNDVLTSTFLAKCREKGVLKLWIRKSELADYQAYLASPAPASAPVAAAAPEPQAPSIPTAERKPPEAPLPPPETEIGGQMRETLLDRDLSSEKKTEEISKQAQAVVQSVTDAKTPEEQTKANEQARKILQDVLATTLKDTQSLAGEIWQAAGIDPELDHALNVATYATLFAMAFGRIDEKLLADIALAGMLHDLGLTQLPLSSASSLLTRPLTNKDPYPSHVQDSLRLIQKYSKDVPERVLTLIGQHHEKFDGTGYPLRAQGFHFNDIAQLVAMADVMDAFASGRWDGTIRTLKESMLTLEKLEKSRTFPEFFNPEVFAAVLKWTKMVVESDRIESAEGIVAQQSQRIVEDKKKPQAA